MATNDLTPAEKKRLADLMAMGLRQQTALEFLALERGEWPGLYEDGKPVPWPPPDKPPEP